jgi:ribosomal protein S18 acetylase RimI-like enzyme
MTNHGSLQFTLHPLRAEFHQGVVDTINEYFCWVNDVPAYTTLEQMRAEWNHSLFNPETDACVAVDAQGQVVGFTDAWDITSVHARIGTWVSVRRDLVDQGIEDALLAWVLRRALEMGQPAPEEARLVVHAMANAASEQANAVYQRNGFQVVRGSYHMLIDFDQPITPQIPEGVVIRPFEGEAELRDAIYTAYDAFRDHWGHIDEPFEPYYTRWIERLKDDPIYDPSLYLAAFENGQMAGVSLCYPKIEDKPETGWVGTLAVRRPWRKRGLGLALLQQSFAEFQARGLKHAGLGVDAQNLTGALRLYERAGMHVWHKFNTYEYELRQGVDLMTQTVQA